VFWAGIAYINRLINRGPDTKTPHEGVPNRPITGAAGGPDRAKEAG
jgi:hypothetical protein